MKNLRYSLIFCLLIFFCCSQKEKKNMVPVYQFALPNEYIINYLALPDEYTSTYLPSNLDTNIKTKRIDFDSLSLIKVIINKNNTFYYKDFYAAFSLCNKKIDSLNKIMPNSFFLKNEYYFLDFFSNNQNFLLYTGSYKPKKELIDSAIQLYQCKNFKLLKNYRNVFFYEAYSHSVNSRASIILSNNDKFLIHHENNTTTFLSLNTGKQIKKDSLPFYQNKYYGIYYDTLANEIKYIINGKIAETINNSRIKNLVQLTFKQYREILFKGDKPFIEFDSIDAKGINHLLFFDNTTPAFRFLSTTTDNFYNGEKARFVETAYWEGENFVYINSGPSGIGQEKMKNNNSTLFDVFNNKNYYLKDYSFNCSYKNSEIEKNGNYILNGSNNENRDTIGIDIFDIKKGNKNYIGKCNLHTLWISENTVADNLENEEINNNYKSNRFFITGNSKQRSLADNGCFLTNNGTDTLSVWNVYTLERPIKKIVVPFNKIRLPKEEYLNNFHLDKGGEYVVYIQNKYLPFMPVAKISTRTGEVILEKVYNSLPELLEGIIKENSKR